ncbi:hypothetical protein Tco_1286893, partial [Tanacetum coccineum]
VPKKIIEKEEVAEEQTIEIPTVAHLLDEVNKAAQETLMSPYDTESKIKVVKSFFTSQLSKVQDQTMNDYEESAGTQEDSYSDLQSIPDDDLRSISEFQATESDDTHENEVSHSAHTSRDIASAERLIMMKIKSSLPVMITNALIEQLPGILSATFKDCLPLIINESLQTHNPAVSELFVTLQKELSKVIKSEVAKKKDTNAIPAPTQREHKTAENITPPKPSPETQGELGYKESTLLVFETKVNEESAMILYNPEKDLVDLTTTEQDSEDDDDLDK